mgnify:CR=1 FL=1
MRESHARIAVPLGLPRYSGWIAWAAEGQRLAVMTCLRCGAAVLYQQVGKDGVDPPALHDDWHDHIEAHVTEVPL